MPRENNRPLIQFRIRDLLAAQAIVIPLAWIVTLLYHRHWTSIFALAGVSWLAGVASSFKLIHRLRSSLDRGDVLFGHETPLQRTNADLAHQIRWNYWSDLQCAAFVAAGITAFALLVVCSGMHTPRELLKPHYWLAMAMLAAMIAAVGGLIAPWCGVAYVRLLRRFGVWS